MTGYQKDSEFCCIMGKGKFNSSISLHMTSDNRAGVLTECKIHFRCKGFEGEHGLTEKVFMQRNRVVGDQIYVRN